MMNSRRAALGADSPQVSVTIGMEHRVIMGDEGTVSADGCRYQRAVGSMLAWKQPPS